MGNEEADLVDLEGAPKVYNKAIKVGMNKAKPLPTIKASTLVKKTAKMGKIGPCKNERLFGEAD